MKNGRDIGREHLATLETFLGGGGKLPVSDRDGSLNLSELARMTGIPKSSFYQNPAIADRIEVARGSQGIQRRHSASEDDTEAGRNPTVSAPVSATGESKLRALERRLQRLEAQNAALVAENAELRDQKRKLESKIESSRLQAGREDMTIETGRRVVVPSPD